MMHLNKTHYLLLATLALGCTNVQAMESEDNVLQEAGYATAATRHTGSCLLDWQNKDLSDFDRIIPAFKKEWEEARGRVRVNLSGSQLGDSGILSTLANISQGRHLQELDLVGVRLDHQEIGNLADILKAHYLTLEFLDLENTGIGNKEVIDLISQVGNQNLPGVQIDVNLEGNNINNIMKRALKAALRDDVECEIVVDRGDAPASRNTAASDSYESDEEGAVGYTTAPSPAQLPGPTDGTLDWSTVDFNALSMDANTAVVQIRGQYAPQVTGLDLSGTQFNDEAAYALAHQPQDYDLSYPQGFQFERLDFRGMTGLNTSEGIQWLAKMLRINPVKPVDLRGTGFTASDFATLGQEMDKVPNRHSDRKGLSVKLDAGYKNEETAIRAKMRN